jgi:hypothetical protein
MRNHLNIESLTAPILKRSALLAGLVIASSSPLLADGESEFYNLYDMWQCQTSTENSRLNNSGDFFVLQSRVDSPISLASLNGYEGAIQAFPFLVLNYDFNSQRINDWLLFGVDDKNYVDFSYISNDPQGLIDENKVIESIAIDVKHNQLRIKHAQDSVETVYSCDAVVDGQTRHGNFVYFIDYIEAVFPNAKSSVATAEAPKAGNAADEAERNYLFKISASGRLDSQPVHVAESFEYYDCNDVIGDYFGDWGYDTLALMTEEYGMASPDKSWCSVSQGKPGTMFANTISVDYYMDGANFNDCVYNNNCVVRNMMELQIKGGEIYFNSTVQRGAEIKMACFKGGDIVNLKGCYAVN